MSEEGINSPRPDRPAMPLPKVLIHQASESDNAIEDDERVGGDDLPNDNNSDAQTSAASNVASPETGEFIPRRKEANGQLDSTDSQEVVDIKPSESGKSDSMDAEDAEPSHSKYGVAEETQNLHATTESAATGVKKASIKGDIDKESHHVLEEPPAEVTVEDIINESSVSSENKENAVSVGDKGPTTVFKTDASEVDTVSDQQERCIQNDGTLTVDSVAETRREATDNQNELNKKRETRVEDGDVKHAEKLTSPDSVAEQHAVEDEATTEIEKSVSLEPRAVDAPIQPSEESENIGIQENETNFTETETTDEEPTANDVESESQTDVSQEINKPSHKDEEADKKNAEGTVETPDNNISTKAETGAARTDEETSTADKDLPTADEKQSSLENETTTPISLEEKPDLANISDDKSSSDAEDLIGKESNIPLTQATDNLATIPRSPVRSPKMVRFSSNVDSRTSTPEKRGITATPPLNESATANTENKIIKSSIPEKSSPIPIFVRRTSEIIDQDTKNSLDITIDEIANGDDAKEQKDNRGIDDHQRQNDDMVSANERENTENASRTSNHSHGSEARTFVEHTMTPELQSRKSESPPVLETPASSPENELEIGSYKPSVAEDQVSLRRQQIINENDTLRVKIHELNDEVNRLEEEKSAQTQKLSELNLRMTRLMKDDEKNVLTITKQNEEINTLKDTIDKHQQKLERNEQQLNGNSKMIDQPVTKKSTVCVLL